MSTSIPIAPRVAFVDNIIMLIDSYKVSHDKQYPPKNEVIYA